MADIKIMKDGVDMMVLWRQRAAEAHEQKPYWERVDKFERRKRAQALSDSAVVRIADDVAKRGPQLYSPRELLCTIGEEAFNVAVSYDARFITALKCREFDWLMTPLPDGRYGFETALAPCVA